MSSAASGWFFTRAIVTANQDPEKQGRIQVRYPGRNSGSREIPTEWARLCSPYASKDSGAWFLPEVGDEVLVVIEGGRITEPLVIGSLHGPKNPPPKSDLSGDLNSDGKNQLRFIKTKSGNLLAFDDAKDAIQLKETSGAQLKVEKGTVALGTSSIELLDQLVSLLDSLVNAAPTFVSTAVGPGILNPALMAKAAEVKAKISTIKGKL